MPTWGPAGFRLSPSSTASYGYLLGGQAKSWEYTQINPVVPAYVFAWESDTGRMKIGDGVSDWNTLPYYTIPMPYGSCYGLNIGFTKTSMVQNTWYDVLDSDIQSGSIQFTSHSQGLISYPTPGHYHVSFQISMECNANNKHIEVGIKKTGTVVDNARVIYETKTANSQFSVSGASIVSIVSGGTINISVRTTDTGTPNIIVYNTNLTSVYLGL